MASPGELVRVMAEVLGVPKAAVVQHDRNLLLAGKRSKGGRGRSAARVTVSDAANLLIPVAAASLIKDTVEAWADYFTLPPDNSDSEKLSWHVPLAKLQALSPTHSFGDAVVALIGAARDGSLQQFWESQSDRGDRSAPSRRSLSITLQAVPRPQARISFETGQYSQSIFYSHPMPIEDEGFAKWAEEIQNRHGSGDLITLRSISQKTLFAIGELLNT